MSFPIVNTPFARDSAAKPDLHFFGNRGILLHRKMAGNYPRIPGITLGLGLVHYPLLPVTHRFALLVQSSGLAPLPWWKPGRATNNMSQFRWHHKRTRRILLLRPAGLLVTMDDPMRRSHHPRAFAPSCQQCYEVTIDGPMQFAFANPLALPTRRIESLLFDPLRFSWASHLAAGHVSDTLVKRGSGKVGSQARQ